MAMMTLLGLRISVYTRIARLVLEEKEIDYELEEVDIFADGTRYGFTGIVDGMCPDGRLDSGGVLLVDEFFVFTILSVKLRRTYKQWPLIAGIA